MPQADYIKPNDEAFSGQLLTFKNNIATHAAALNVTAAEMTAQAADADYFAYAMACHLAVQNSAQQWTAWKDLLRDGGTPPGTGAPSTAPGVPAAVPAVAPGIEPRFRALAQRIKGQGNYNPAIGEALAIEGPMQTGPDMETIKPVIKIKLMGGVVIVGWGWGGNSQYLDSIEIEVDRGDGQGFRFLTIDTTPDYNDTHALPAAPARWKYRAIYRVGDHRVGVWSDTVEITVGG